MDDGTLAPCALHLALERSGRGLLQQVRSAPVAGEVAMELLAADALITFAAESAAEAPETPES